MSIRLEITNTKDPEFRDERVMDGNIIRIGREGTNDLCFPDPKRVISKQHATLERDGTNFYLVDCRSTNGTELNGQDIEPEKRHLLSGGDEFKIGEFLIRFCTLPDGQPLPDEQAEVAIEDYPPDNNFKATINNLQAELRKAQAKIQQLTTENKRIKVAAAQHSPDRKASNLKEPLSSDSLSTREQKVLGDLLVLISKLIKLPSQFRNEFFGEDPFSRELSKDEIKLLAAEGDEWAKQFLSPEIDQNKFEARLSLLKKAIEEVIVHQLAFLEGYQYAIEEGIQVLLAQLGPSNLEEDIRKMNQSETQKFLLRFLPFYLEWRTWHSYQQKHRELTAEDRGRFEQKHFRPAFRKGYDERWFSR